MPCRRAVITIAIVLAVPAATGRTALSGQTPPAAPAARPGARLFKDSRQLLALARAEGRREVSVLLAATATAGSVDAVAKEATRLGAAVRYREDTSGYVRVRIAIDRVAELLALDRIEAAALDFDEGVTLGLDAGAGTLAPQEATPPAGRWPPRASDTPLRDAYSPHGDLDAREFLARHPTYDGRGVTVAVLDGHADWLLPELQLAWTADGRPVPKFADVINATDPRDDADALPQWVNMREQVTGAGGRVTAAGKTFAIPRDGAYRIGFFNERRFSSPANAAYINQDVDRNGNPKDDDGLFAVLWDEQTNEVWVDTDRSLSFADDKPLTDYRVRQDVGVFGKDRPETPVRDSIAFTVQTDRANAFISINLGLYQHGTMVIGALAANRRPHGRFDGVAPGCQVVSIFYGIRQGHAMIEGLITAFTDPRVDLVLLEQNSTLGNDYALSDARHVISVVIERLVERHRKLILVPGSNAPGLGLVDEPGAAPGAISVGGYQSRESYRRNHGYVPMPDDNMHFGGLSHGPAGNGALKPDLLAPSGHMGNDPAYRMGGARKGLYQLPPGYTIGGGTSEATPTATGAVVLLISAAKQAGVPHDADRLKAAVMSSTRWIGRLGAVEQGNGLIQVGAAWEALKALATTPARIQIASRGPVRTVLGHLLATPHEGVGLFEREGWTAGARGDRTVIFTRTSGPAGPMTFALAWRGNDGTFTSPASVTLPLGKPVGVAVGIAATSPGVHSAVLALSHPSQPGDAHRLLATVVATEPFTAANGYRLRYEGQVPRPGDRGYFVLVPPGVEALKVDAVAKGAPIRLTLLPPDRGTGVTSGAAPGEQSTTVERPMPGVWEINLWNGQDSFAFDPDAPEPVPPTPVVVTASLLGFDARTASGIDGGPAALTLAATNRFAAVTAAFATAMLGSAAEARRTIAPGEQQTAEIQVPAGSDAVWARVRAGAAGADLDLYLFDCTGKTCEPRGKSIRVDSDEWVKAPNPAAGRWLVVIDAHVASGPVEYDYIDVITNPRFGAVHAADVPAERGAGATWTTAASAWVASPPPAPRRPYALVPVVSSGAKTIVRVGATELRPPAVLGFVELSPGQVAKPTLAEGRDAAR